MSTENMSIEKGMKAYGSDGAPLGTISQVWMAPEEATIPSEDYVEVDEGGFLGIGARRLFIPFSAVETILPHESVTLNCSKDQCIALYATKPEFVKKKEEEVMAAEAAIVASTTPVIFH